MKSRCLSPLFSLLLCCCLNREAIPTVVERHIAAKPESNHWNNSRRPFSATLSMPTARIIPDPRLVQQLRAYLKRMGYHRDDHRLACWEQKEPGERDVHLRRGGVR